MPDTEARSTVDRVTDDDLELVDPSTIVPHPENPRVHDDARLRSSIGAHGVIDVCVVQRSTRLILGGSGRHEQAVGAGATRMPVLWVDCDDDEATEIMLALNATSDAASYNERGVVALIERVRERAGTIEATGWDDASFGAVIERIRAADEAAAPKEPTTPDEPMRDIPLGVAIRVGDYSGYIATATYDSFREAYEAKREETGEVLFDDVLTVWLGL